ncbi:MAG: hypothetical protein ACKN94_01480, partial [Pirellulaceae bacterium]
PCRTGYFALGIFSYPCFHCWFMNNFHHFGMGSPQVRPAIVRRRVLVVLAPIWIGPGTVTG